jgi:hypothetical protein
MHPNGTPSTAPPRPPDDPAAGDIFLDLDDEGQAALADHNWMDEQYNQGTFDQFRGEYVAVVNKTVLGHDKNLKRLRETVAKETGIPASRIVTTLIVRQRID